MVAKYTGGRRTGVTPAILIGLALCGGMVAGNANAQWVVTDPGHTALNAFSWGADYAEQIAKLQQLQQQYAKLQEQYQQMQAQYQQGFIGNFSSAGEAVDGSEIEPKRVDVNSGVKERCRLASNPVAALQYEICREIVRTSNAQFNYAVTMYETTGERNERLRAIQQERAGLSQEDQGRLHDNTNKLLALQALMQIDAQQAQTNMDAFDKRLRYLNEQQDFYTDEALNGKRTLLGSITAGVTLKAALEAVKTSD